VEGGKQNGNIATRKILKKSLSDRLGNEKKATKNHGFDK